MLDYITIRHAVVFFTGILVGIIGEYVRNKKQLKTQYYISDDTIKDKSAVIEELRHYVTMLQQKPNFFETEELNEKPKQKHKKRAQLENKLASSTNRKKQRKPKRTD